MHDSPLQNVPAITQQAAEWVVRRDRGLSAAEKRALAKWEEADPRHRVELDRIRGAWNGLNGIGAVPDLVAMADDIAMRARVRRARRRVGRSIFAMSAAAAVITLGFVGWPRMTVPAPSRAALVSENVRIIDSTLRRMALPDGSTAELNGNSRIEVEFTPTERRVRLTEGETYFIVAKNPERPFFVTAGPVTVRAVGTAFNVRVATGEIEVLVTEGKVQIEHDYPAASGPAASSGLPTSPAAAHAGSTAPAALVAGQRAVIDRAASRAAPAVAINEVSRAEINDALGWQTTRLVFNNTPLEEVVAGFNHFNHHQLTLGDPKLRHRGLTGTFRADNLEGFIALLKASIDVKAELRTPTETVLLPMR